MNIEDLPEGTLLLTGYDEALIGFGWRLSFVIAVYDRAKVLASLMRDMNEEDAEEYISYNVEGAYVGEGTPLLITLGEPT